MSHKRTNRPEDRGGPPSWWVLSADGSKAVRWETYQAKTPLWPESQQAVVTEEFFLSWVPVRGLIERCWCLTLPGQPGPLRIFCLLPGGQFQGFLHVHLFLEESCELPLFSEASSRIQLHFQDLATWDKILSKKCRRCGCA